MYAHKMELKVWVEGIQRVICGVTDATTCQDVVIALAHATGKTGRFTLVERWRDSERLLAPTEPPLRVLHKWGEYACDVQFILRHSEKDRRKASSGSSRGGTGSGGSSSGGSSSLDHGSKRTDKFLHNFTPHQQQRRMSSSSIRKSLTFSGAHTFFPPLKSGLSSEHVKSTSGITPPSTSRVPTMENSSLESLGDDRLSYCSSRSSSSPYASLEKQCRRGYVGAGRLPAGNGGGTGSLERGSGGSGSTVSGLRASPRRSPHPGGGSGSGSPLRERQISSSPSSVSHSPQKQSPHTLQRIQQQSIVPMQSCPYKDITNRIDLLQESTNNNNIAKVVGTPHNTEEFNLEQALKSPPPSDLPHHGSHRSHSSHGGSRDFSKHNGTLPEPEVVTEKAASPKKEDLMRLVRLQQERLGVQDSQLKILDSEIQYWEGREKDIDHQYKTVQEETTRLQQTEHTLEECLQELDLVSWVDKLGIEQQQEKMLRSELTLIRSQIQNAESELLAAKSKLTSVMGELEEERRCAVTRDQESKDIEIKMLQEISDLQKQINRKLLQHELHAGSLEQLAAEVKSLESAILEKKSQITDWEKELRAANMTFFVQAPATDWLQPPTNDTEKSFGRLSPSRPGSSRKMLHNPQMLKETVATTKNPHGMWV